MQKNYSIGRIYRYTSKIFHRKEDGYNLSYNCLTRWRRRNGDLFKMETTIPFTRSFHRDTENSWLVIHHLENGNYSKWQSHFSIIARIIRKTCVFLRCQRQNGDTWRQKFIPSMLLCNFKVIIENSCLANDYNGKQHAAHFAGNTTTTDAVK